MTKYLRNSSKIILDAATRLEEKGSLPDLIVSAGETRILSSKAPQTSQFYQEFKPASAAEVKDLLGIPDSIAKSTLSSKTDFTPLNKNLQETRAGDVALNIKSAADAEIAKRSLSIVNRNIRQLPGKIIAVNRLIGDDIEQQEKLENQALARTATEAYIYGNSSEVASWVPLIEAYLQKLGPKVFVPIFRNITVNNNATLNIASDTLAIYANRIRLYGNGKINCVGPKTFHCTSFEGFL